MLRLTKMFGLFLATFLLVACPSGIYFKNAKLGGPWDFKSTTVIGVLSKPEGTGPFPAVVLLHACGGISDHETSYWPRIFSRWGYVTLAVDSHGGCLLEEQRKVHVKVAKDAYGALDYLANQPFVDKNSVGVMGFSSGAHAINRFGAIPGRSRRKLDFKAGVSFYGNCEFLDSDYQPTFPIMEIVGDKDSWSVGCTTLTGDLPVDDLPVKVHILPGVYHAFDMINRSGRIAPSGNLMIFDEVATKKAQNLTRAFFDKHMGK